MRCSRCGYDIKEENAVRCPRCFKILLAPGGCSNCGKCNKGQVFKNILCKEK